MNDVARTLMEAALRDIAAFDAELAGLSGGRRDVRRSWRFHSYFATRAFARHRIASACTVWIRSCTEAAVVGDGLLQNERPVPMYEIVLGPLEASLSGWVDVVLSERQALLHLAPREVERQVLFHATEQNWEAQAELVRDCSSTAPERLGEDDRLLLEQALFERAELRLVSVELEQVLGFGRRFAGRIGAPPLAAFDESVRTAIPASTVLERSAAFIREQWFGAEPLSEVLLEVIPEPESEPASARASELASALQLTPLLLGADDLPWSDAPSEWA